MKLVERQRRGIDGIYVVPAAYRGLSLLQTPARRHFPRRALGRVSWDIARFTLYDSYYWFLAT